MTLVDIGKIFGMDYSTVIYGIQKAKAWKKTGYSFA